MMVDQVILSFSTIPPIHLVQLNYLFIFNHSIQRSITISLTCNSNNFNHLIHWSKCILKFSNHLWQHHQIYHFNCANNSFSFASWSSVSVGLVSWIGLVFKLVLSMKTNGSNLGENHFFENFPRYCLTSTLILEVVMGLTMRSNSQPIRGEKV